MAITVTEGTANTTASATFDVTVPAHTAGDLLVLVAAKNQGSSSAPGISTAGWTTSLQVPNASATNHILLGYKTGDGSESTVRVTNMAGGAALIGKVYRVQGSTGAVVGTPDSESASDVTTTALDVGTAATGDVGFVALAFANTTSSPALSNGYTLDESNAYYLLGYKVLDSTDDSVTATWTTSRSYRAGLLVFEAATGGGVPRVMFHRQMQGMA